MCSQFTAEQIHALLDLMPVSHGTFFLRRLTQKSGPEAAEAFINRIDAQIREGQIKPQNQADMIGMRILGLSPSEKRILDEVAGHRLPRQKVSRRDFVFSGLRIGGAGLALGNSVHLMLQSGPTSRDETMVRWRNWLLESSVGVGILSIPDYIQFIERMQSVCNAVSEIASATRENSSSVNFGR